MRVCMSKIMKEYNNLADFSSLLTPFELKKPKNEIALSLFIECLTQGIYKYDSAVASVAVALKWRWVGVSRYEQGKINVEVLSWWEDNALSDTFNYQLAGTPCEKILNDESVDFVTYSNVESKFPKDEMLTQLGVKCYCGFTYRN